MADQIDRQAAIKVMTSVLWHLPNEWYRNLNEYEFSKGLAELGLNSVPSVQPEPKWIPCSERLPEKYGWYLCTLKDTRVNTYYWNNKGEWVDNGKKHFFELYNISSRYTGENITAEQEGSVYWTDWVIAWMPLSEPYRAERRTDEPDK